MKARALLISTPRANRGSVDTRSLVFALTATVCVLLAFGTAHFSSSLILRLALLCLATVAVGAQLFRVYAMTKQSSHSNKLAVARAHILLQLVPLGFFVTLVLGINLAAVNLALVVLFFLFFGSGRMTWETLGKLFPATLLYRIFFRVNSAFLWSFPVIYVTSLLLPEMLSFALIKNVALFYFSVHFTILGVSSLKIESDLLQGPG